MVDRQAGIDRQTGQARPRPKSWKVRRSSISSVWLTPFHALDWVFEWTAYGLSRWALLEVLEYAGSLSVLVAIVFYFSESGDRRKQKHYQAWQVITSAQGKGGSGGRIGALQELNEDRIPLVGVDASGAFLQGVRLHGANLLRCDLSAADLRMSDLSLTNLHYCKLTSGNFQSANLRDADLKEAQLDDANLADAGLQNADLSGASLKGADLRRADLRDMKWRNIASIDHANIRDVRNAPEGFIAWAVAHQAVTTGADQD
jgi:hypothetical protein